MSDLISRQDVISTIQKYNFDFPQYMERFVTELRDAMKADLEHDIRNLPSVQPVIIRCKDCKHFELANNKLANQYEVTGCFRLKKLSMEDPLLTHGTGFCSWAERRQDE